MNRRQKKKFTKKLFHRTYSEVRRAKILCNIQKYIDENYTEEDYPIIPLITMSRNGKHVNKAVVLIKGYPSSISSSLDQKKEVDMVFSCNSYTSPQVDSCVSQMYQKWIEGLREPNNE